MEGLIWGLLLAAIFFFALYLVARAALRDGIREAREGRGGPAPAAAPRNTPARECENGKK